MDRKIIELYNDYVHSAMPRRQFLDRLAKLAGGIAAAAAIVPLIEPDYAYGQQISTDDDRLETGYITYAGVSGAVRAYMARPKGAGKLPAILVIHENRGLNKHIEDVARRAALAGYHALAPDGLTSAGGAPEDQEAARNLFGKTDRDLIVGDILAGVGYLKDHPDSTGKIGSVGFCFGGGTALRCAVDVEGIDAAVSFYGRTLNEEQVAKVKVPLMMHYAGNDKRINAGIVAFRAALDARSVAYSLNMYPGTNHGFHNDTSAGRYDSAAATLAWSRTLNFFETYLKG